MRRHPIAIRPAAVFCSHATFIRRLPAIVARSSAFASPSSTSFIQYLELEAICQHQRLGAAVRAARQELQRPPPLFAQLLMRWC
jgi:hypothetical protein